MSCAPGKSIVVGLLLATFASLLTSCQYFSLTETDRAQAVHASTKRIKILVEEDGLSAVSLRDLTQSGLAIKKLSPSELNLTLEGSPVPYLIEEERLIFYGQAPRSRYTNARPYVLEIGQPGKPMHQTDVPDISEPQVLHVPQTVHLEENQIYSPEAHLSEDADVWFWAELNQGETFDIHVDLPNLNQSTGHINIGSWGYTDLPDVYEDHDFDLQVNDKTVGRVIWDGQTHNVSELDLRFGSLNQGMNKLTLDNRPEGASFLDIIHINWLEIVYEVEAIAIDDRLTFSAIDGLVQMSGFTDKPLIFNISDPTDPKLLTGWQYDDGQFHLPVTEKMTIAAVGPNGFNAPTIEPFHESSWRDPHQQADLIIVTTDELAPSLAPLIQAREDEGLSIALVPVEAVYDEFGYGKRSPESIRQFVTYAYSNWQEPRPKYLFLVGDATTDYHHNLSREPANLIPTFFVPVQFGGETVSDSRLADIDGDHRPELAVGRWPVQTKQEAESLVRRTLSYERGTAGNSAIFISDGSEERFSNVVERISLNSQIPADHVQQLEKGQKSKVVEQLNSGTWLATYVGHGSVNRWGKDGIFDREAAVNLKNEEPPIIVHLTCLTGLFAHPDETSLVEAMLAQPGGPVLSVAATSLTLSSHQEPFAIQLLQSMQDPNIIRIGDAFEEAKLSLDLDSSDGFREISDTFTLFGDPTTRIVRP